MVNQRIDSDSLILIGRDYCRPAEKWIQSVTDRIVVGISSGYKHKNEDALAVVVREDETLLAVADGHWGHEASELAVRKAVEMFESSQRPPESNEMRGRLYALFEQINRALCDIAMASPGAPMPETSLIVCFMRCDRRAAQLYWASFGDSYLFLQTSGTTRQLNTLNPRWLGALSKMAEQAGAEGISLVYPKTGLDRYLGVAAGVESGIEELSAGDLLLLCTDGLIEPAGREFALTPADLCTIFDMTDSAEVKVQELTKLAFERGGGDNMACVLAEI